jgi:hypothetical protein
MGSGLEVGVEAVGVGEGEFAECGAPALDEGSFDEFGDSGAFVLGFAGLLGAFSGSL